MPKGINARIANKGTAVIVRPDGTIRRLLANNTFAERLNHIPLFSLLSEYANPDISVSFAGTTQVSGQITDIVSLSLIPAAVNSSDARLFDSMTRTLFFVDQSTNMVDKIQSTNFSENDPNCKQTVEVYFDQYQAIAGIWVPLHQQIYEDGKLDSEIWLKSVNVNVGLADGEFAIPAGGTNVQ
jgi:hypothetical protein